MTFSERYGFKKSNENIQFESIDNALKNGLWNALYPFISDISTYISDAGFFQNIFIRLWTSVYKNRIDELPNESQYVEYIRNKFFNCKWYEIYDLLEYFLNIEGRFGIFTIEENQSKEILEKAKIFYRANIEKTLVEEMSGYRVVNNKFVPITDKQQIQSIETSINKLNKSDKLLGARRHLQDALTLMSDRSNPNYRNSIKDSISAVEALCQVIAEDEHATLGQAIKVLDEKIGIHSSLKGAYSKLYGYTSNADGIRHAMSEDTALYLEDALYMLVSCSAFINYIVSKCNRVGFDLN